MSNSYRQTINELQGEIEACQQRIHQLDKVMEVLAPLAGPDEDDEPAAAAPRAKTAAKAKPARSVAIVAHGKPSSLRAFGIKAPFFTSREEALA